MALKKITYFIDGKKKIIKVKICDTILKKSVGLMFKRNSPSLFFTFSREKTLSIHSFFCKPFRAVWLDERMVATRFVDVNNWKFHISGRGKYLLEIPMSHK